MAEDQHVDTENSNKRIGKSVLDHFSQVSNDNEAKRIKNASSLLQYLYKSSNEQNYDEVQYALKRIVRGLGGSKNTSRIGFYSTFVAFLHTFPFITLYEVLECVRKHLQIEGGNSKSEIGDIYIGQVLACGALIRSKKIFSGRKEQQEDVLNLLINAGKSRSYLSMASVIFIAELMKECDQELFKRLWSVLSTVVLIPWTQQTLDSFYLLLLTQKSFPAFIRGSQLNKVLSTPEVLCEQNLEAICNVVLNISSISSLKHYLYPLLAETIATSNMDLPFVTELDHQLRKYNRNKIMAASLLIRNILPHLQDTSKIPEFLPENFVRQILQHYRNNRAQNKNDDEFHQEITNFFDGLCKCLHGEVDAKTKINVLKKIIFYPGSFMFESVTKSKNVQKIVRTLEKEGVKKLSSLYRDVLVMKKEKVVGVNTTEQWLNSERVYSAQLLTKLLNFPSVQAEVQWKVKNLKLFLDIGVFKDKYENVGIELANNVKDVFFRALDLKFNKLDDVVLVLYELVGYLKSVLGTDELRTPLTDEELKAFDKMNSVVSKLDTKKETDECALVFEVLFLHMGLQLFQDKELAVSSLNELFSCYERVSKKRKDVGDPEWIEVVVDLFLNLLSHNSLLLRNIVGSVFPYLCKFLTPSSVHQILSVLDPKNEANPLSHNESESEDEDRTSDDEENEEEDDEENETVNDKLRMAVRAALGNNGYQTDEESVDLDDMDEADADNLDKALANAFRQFKPNRGKSKKQSKQDETLTHFRIRVLDLIEIYLDSEPNMLSCLEIMLPLLQVLEFSIKNDHQKPLLIRVRHCLRKLSGVKKFGSVDGITDATLGDLLNNLLEKGTKNSLLIQDMSNEISECCVFIIKCSQIDSLPDKTRRRCQAKVIEILADCVNVYFKQRDCLIPYYLFKSVFQLHWDGNLVFAPQLFSFVFNNDIRPFRRNQALELLKIFYTNRRDDETFNKFLKTVDKHEKKLCDDVVTMLDEFCQRPKSKQIKEKFVGNLFSMLRAMLAHGLKNQNIDWKQLGSKIREFRSHIPLSRDARITFNQLCRVLQIPHTVKMKAEVVKFSNKDDSDDEPSTKKQKSGETKKQKKESKTTRIQSMSEGLSDFSFSNLNDDEIDEEVTNTNGIENTSKKLHKKRKRLSNV